MMKKEKCEEESGHWQEKYSVIPNPSFSGNAVKTSLCIGEK